MKVVVDIPDSLIDQVREAVQHGEYEDAREFATVALENQVELEFESGDSGDLMTLEQAIETESEKTRTDEGPVVAASSANGIYGPYALNRHEYDAVTTVPTPDPSRLDGGPLWGQYNRIFPVKLALRVLANELRNQATHADSQIAGTGDELVSLERFRQRVSDIAREYGLKVQQADQKKSRGRGTQLSAALPVGDDPKKSKGRFQVHFIGDTDQQGDLKGAAPQLRFVNIPEGSPRFIGITKAGLEFAEMWNPLIDGGASSDDPLTEDEAAFYLQHVQEHIPDEYNAMQLVASAITEGDNRPDSLSARVAVLNEDWSEEQASTVRSGLVSRMYELGLLRRERVGQRGIAYKLTNDGHDFQTTHNV